MGSEVAPRVVQGRAFNGGVAMDVARAPGLVRITLTLMPGHPATTSAEGETAVIAFPEPVPVAAGERVAILTGYAAGGTEDYAGPVWIPVSTVLTCAHIRR
jgi:hypothetical protein